MMNIALAFSPNWSKYVAVEMYAIYKNNPAPVHIYLFSDNLNHEIGLFESVKNYFGEGYEYTYINMEQKYNELMPSGINVETRFSKYTLYRLMMGEFLPETVERILYIDTDAIVNKNLEEFYYMDMGENLLIGVADNGVEKLKLQSGFAPEDKYINAGVSLLNLKRIRELGIDKQWRLLYYA
jgi:lipopolysaccharide biosynthesis glycosyltransferase